MNLLALTTLGALLISAVADSLYGTGNDSVRRELQTYISRKYLMTIEAMEPVNPDLLTPCVTDQMIAVLQAWADTLYPSETVVSSNATVAVTAPAGAGRELATTYVKISTTLHCYTCTNCRRIRRRRKLQTTTASVSMVKVLLPLVCPEIQNITTVNMTLSSV